MSGTVWDGTRITGISLSGIAYNNRYLNFDFSLADRGGSSAAPASDAAGRADRTWAQFTTAANSWTAGDMLDFGNTASPAPADAIASPFAAWDTNVVSRGFPRLKNVNN